MLNFIGLRAVIHELYCVQRKTRTKTIRFVATAPTVIKKPAISVNIVVCFVAVYANHGDKIELFYKFLAPRFAL